MCWTSIAAADESRAPAPDFRLITGVEPIDLSGLPVPLEAPDVGRCLVGDGAGGEVAIDIEPGDRIVPRVTWMGVREALVDYSRLPEYCAAETRAHDRAWRVVLRASDRVAGRELRLVQSEAFAATADHWSPTKVALGISLGVVGGAVVGVIVGGIAGYVMARGGQVVVVGSAQ